MSGLTYVNIDELKEGDIVGVRRYPSFGWNRHFRYPVIYKRSIKRITPKRTKFILDDGVELDVRSAKELIVIDSADKEEIRKSNLAKNFEMLSSIRYKLEEARRQSNYIIEDKLTDEELADYIRVMNNIYNKYIIGGKKD